VVRAERLTDLHDDFTTLPLAVVRQIDELADEFESAWRSGGAPDSNAFVERLEGANDEARAVLANHLTEVQSELDSPERGSPPLLLAPPREIRLADRTVQVGEYRLVEQLGSGGMGIVYKAVHSRLDRFVAIKFPRFVAALDPRSAARFLREARMIGRLNHPNVVRALDAGESIYGPYLVTEYIEGETLEELVRRSGPLSIDQAVAITRQAAAALAYAHTQNIVHRDVKPSNLLLDGAGTLRIVDFGLAKMLADDRLALGSTTHTDDTECGTFLGTVGYASPEQLRPGQVVDHRADVYSLGCVLYFALIGEVLHRGSMADRLLASRKSKPVSLRSLRSDVPPKLDAVWRRMVAPAPQSRFRSMAEVEQALNDAATADANVARRFPLPRRLAIAALLGFAIVGLLAWSAGLFGGSGRPWKLATGPGPAAAVAPFDAQRAKQHQRAWAEHLGMLPRFLNSSDMPFVLLPPGEFMMGMSDGPLPEPQPPAGDWRHQSPEFIRSQQSPRHQIKLTKPLYFGETEVTNAQFRRFVEATGYVTDAERSRGWGREDRGWLKRAGYSWKNLGQRICEDNLPVMNVTWNDATALCQWLTEHEQPGTYRLPTEAEWEYACRAGSESTYFFGDDESKFGDYAWLSINSEGRYRKVALKRPNAFGLYDVLGNRQEWCLDVYDADFYASSPVADPICESGSEKYVLRGGTHTDLPAFCTSARRWSQAADDLGGAGIRVVLEP
jgi:eukaryotic-like serine/threonine-protein kinase